MNLNFQAGSSPLASRQNPVIYLVLVVAAIIALVFVGIWIITMIRKREKETPEYQEKEMKRLTKYKDVTILQKTYNLDKKYVPLLWDICRQYKVPNILFSIKHIDDFDDIFRDTYQNLKRKRDVEKINLLFRLKFELDKIFASQVIYKKTHSLPAGLKMNLVLRKGTIVPVKIKENTVNYLEVEIPQDFFNSTQRPDETDKIAFAFNSETGMPHTFITRLIRYQVQGNSTVMIINHTEQMMNKMQRQFKRVSLKENCRFSSAKNAKDQNGEKYFKIGEKKYSGILLNISGGGCCIASQLPIKENQIICTEFDFFDGTIKPLGKIIKSRKTHNKGVYNLHIMFLPMDTEIQNKILAKVYAYD